jgi:hypothetical protein
LLFFFFFFFLYIFSLLYLKRFRDMVYTAVLIENNQDY